MRDTLSHDNYMCCEKELAIARRTIVRSRAKIEGTGERLMRGWLRDRRDVVMLGGILVVAWAIYFGFGLPAGKPLAAVASLPVQTPTVTAAPGRASHMEVYITGAVRKPGLYSLPVDARVAAAVAAAGGALSSADLNGINLAAVVEDGMQVVVPSASDVAPPVQGIAQTASSQVLRTPGDQRSTRHGSSHKLQPGERIDVNKASVAQFEELPGIGAKRAGTLYSYRSAHGLFTSLSQLGSVPGIGGKELAKILPYATL